MLGRSGTCSRAHRPQSHPWRPISEPYTAWAIPGTVSSLSYAAVWSAASKPAACRPTKERWHNGRVSMKGARKLEAEAKRARISNVEVCVGRFRLVTARWRTARAGRALARRGAPRCTEFEASHGLSSTEQGRCCSRDCAGSLLVLCYAGRRSRRSVGRQHAQGRRWGGAVGRIRPEKLTMTQPQRPPPLPIGWRQAQRGPALTSSTRAATWITKGVNNHASL